MPRFRSAIACAVVAGLWGAAALAQPAPQIRVNGGKSQVIAAPGASIDIDVALAPGSASGTPGDWWLAAAVNGVLYTYGFTQGWTSSLTPAHQGPLVDVPWSRVVVVPGLAVGQYTLYFAVDRRLNGVPDTDLSHAAVTVTVPDWNCAPPGRNSRSSLSEVQQRFMAARGNPRLFTLSFLTENLGASGTPQVAATPRRLETWVYDREGLVASQFDSGHFVGETRHASAGFSWPPTHLGPGQFSACMTRADVVALMGEPSCTLQGEFGGRRFEHLRYRPTSARSAATVVLENGLVGTVMAGYSFATAGSGSTDLCPTP